METESKKGTGMGGMSSEEVDSFTAEPEAGVETPKAEAEVDETPEATETPEADETPEVKGEAEAEVPEDVQLAEEALAETKSAEETPEVDPKDAVIGDFRRRLREAEQATLQLQGQIEGMATVQARTEPKKSPLELAAEKQDVPIDEVTVDGALFQAQTKWQKAQDKAEAERTAAEQRKTSGEEAIRQGRVDFSEEKMGEGLDLDSICSIGTKYLTRGDQLDIGSKPTAAGATKEAYKRCRQRILESGTPQEKAELRERIIAHKKTRAKPKTGGGTTKPKKDKPASQTANEEADEPEVRASTSSIMDELEMFG